MRSNNKQHPSPCVVKGIYTKHEVLNLDLDNGRDAATNSKESALKVSRLHRFSLTGASQSRLHDAPSFPFQLTHVCYIGNLARPTYQELVYLAQKDFHLHLAMADFVSSILGICVREYANSPLTVSASQRTWAQQSDSDTYSASQ
ncbi:hypothetical protein Tco_1030324 [Tanacetum coccineum]|uniref:Uncharacterized protein n=1 Tax=Tanacetum coccineum TaxID=301880 RepID=A0ABQ5G5W8_9ASTR